MGLYTIPNWVQKHTLTSNKETTFTIDTLRPLKADLQRFNVANPEVSIVIPAYNEEKNLLNTLSSLSNQQTRLRTELIVANNNSKDRTQDLLDAYGVQSVLVTQQGIGFARQAGLQVALGRYVLNADCDCIYPPTWIDALVEPLKNNAVACTYGTYSFLPSEINSRLALTVHETAARASFILRNKRGLEYINVLGFNFAFRKEDALAVGGFRIDAGHQGTSTAKGACEDGWMAMSLLDKGRIQHVTQGAHVWSSDRVLAKDGGVLNAFRKRIVKEIRRLK